MFFNPLIIDLSASKNLKKDLVYTILYSNNLKLEYDEENCIIKVCEKEVDEDEKKIQEKKKQKFEGFFKRKKWGRPNMKDEKEKNVKTVGEGVGFERIRRITGYLVGTVDRFNDGKRAEVEDRVKHGGKEVYL